MFTYPLTSLEMKLQEVTVHGSREQKPMTQEIASTLTLCCEPHELNSYCKAQMCFDRYKGIPRTQHPEQPLSKVGAWWYLG